MHKVIFFSGGPSCGKCVTAKKNLPEVQAALIELGIQFEVVEADGNEDFFVKHGITSYPKYGFFQDGQLVETRSGVGLAAQTIEWVKEILNMYGGK